MVFGVALVWDTSFLLYSIAKALEGLCCMARL
jgi:hypothetical protein